MPARRRRTERVDKLIGDVESLIKGMKRRHDSEVVTGPTYERLLGVERTRGEDLKSAGDPADQCGRESAAGQEGEPADDQEGEAAGEAEGVEDRPQAEPKVNVGVM